jgi:hypothetical protein
MDITLVFSDNTEETFNIHTYDPYEICDYILKSKTLKHKQIKSVKMSETYIKNQDSDDSSDDKHFGDGSKHGPKEPTLEDLQNLIHKYTPFINVKIKLNDINPYVFNIELQGNIFDILGITKGLRLQDEFCRYRTYLNNDINIVNFLLRGADGRNIDTGRSLILRFLSERHCNLNTQQIYDILRHDIVKKDLTDYVSIIFYKVHGIKIDEAKEIEEKTDKLSIKSILNSKIKELDDEIARRLDAPRRAVAPPIRIINEGNVEVDWGDVDL